ncbi:conserved protein [Tepidicaulis marinus]|jgi:hypothetical protein|uniref:UPF0386 protein M2A_1195 n=1 Tax=Tepidicaulis marinus TaxID=1333998 RepID=A0A081B9H8_9HYPH|nr:YjhX family toxin [Tepidicaulis marinus]GAK44696.1 conserved protein [Tepidicaulis marinus]
MNISKKEQRVLHALAQGGRIVIERDGPRKLTRVDCITRDGWFLTDCTEPVFKKLKRRRLIRSQGGKPYRITREGLEAVRAQLDNR